MSFLICSNSSILIPLIPIVRCHINVRHGNLIIERLLRCKIDYIYCVTRHSFDRTNEVVFMLDVIGS